MPKQATQVTLSEKEQEELVRITHRHRSEQQQVLRARIGLAAATGSSNAQIGRDLAINVDTVRLWRDRGVGLQEIDLETLSVAERPPAGKTAPPQASVLPPLAHGLGGATTCARWVLRIPHTRHLILPALWPRDSAA